MIELDERSAWPNLAQAAAMLGLDRSTLSRRARHGGLDCRVEGLGHGPHLVPPREVVRLSVAYARVPQGAVLRRLAAFLAAQLVADGAEVLAALERLAAEDERRGRPDGPPSVEEQGRDVARWLDGALARRRPAAEPAPLDLATDWSQITFGTARPRGFVPDEADAGADARGSATAATGPR